MNLRLHCEIVAQSQLTESANPIVSHLETEAILHQRRREVTEPFLDKRTALP